MPRLSLGSAGRCVLLAALILCAALVWFAALAPRAHAARGLELGFNDPEYASPDAAVRTSAFDRTVQAGAQWTIIYVVWGAVAPTEPHNPKNQHDPEYHWDQIDAAVQDASARGLKVLMAVTRAPDWAEGLGRPSKEDAPPGTWRPSASALGEFAQAIASRYDGKTPGLPAVHHWQVWAEPNLGVNLSPQFEGNTPVGFDVYRPMLNAFYSNVKEVSQQNVVVTGGPDPRPRPDLSAHAAAHLLAGTALSEVDEGQEGQEGQEEAIGQAHPRSGVHTAALRRCGSPPDQRRGAHQFRAERR